MNTIILDRNENQYGPAPACYRALRESGLEQMSLYTRDFAEGRKSRLSARLSEDIGIPEQRVLLSYGSEEMLKQIVQCYLDGDKTMLLPKQSWWYYKALAKEVNAQQIEYTLHERNGTFEYDTDELIALYDLHMPRMILIASPNNPTGSSMPAAELERLIAHCQSSIILLDQAYYGFTHAADVPATRLLALNKNLVILRTFSKYYALAGMRIGYTCIGENLTDLITYSARYLGYNQVSERVALAALDSADYYARITRLMHEDMQRYVRDLGAVPGFVPFRSDANFILVRYPAPWKAALQAGLRRRDIVIKFLDDPGLQDCVRITLGTREQNAHVITAMREIAYELRVPVPAAAYQQASL